MRVFWPTDAAGTGVALGWASGDALVVAAVVPDAGGAALAGLKPLAAVVDSDAPTPTPGLTIRVEAAGRPVAYSTPATTILYTPPPARAVLGVHAAPGGDYAPRAASDLPVLLELINAVEPARAALGLAPQPGGALLDLGALAAVPLAFDLAQRVVGGRIPTTAGDAVPLAAKVALLAAGRVLAPRAWLPPSVLAAVAAALSASVGVLGVRMSPAQTAFLGHIQRRAATLSALVEVAPDATAVERARAHLAAEDAGLAVLYDHLLGALATLGMLYALAFGGVRLPALSPAVLADPVVAALGWLNDWPFGLKLNTPLSQGFCSAFTALLLAWRDRAVPALAAAPPIALTALLLTAPLLGLSSALALLADAIALLTLHLRLCHFATAALCRWQLSALRGLWDLFRGKRWNVLRHRTDSYTYDTDTLFLGTLFFMLSAFLAPTVLAYWGLFAGINLAISCVQRAIGAAIGGIDTLPYRATKHVAGGVIFDLVPLADGFALELKGTPG
ncbi:pig-Q [Vanrija albida]|uniref:Pig-Q n=1 Tax=Vanrija albida TaxID=181172 RepID=A0ABR3QBV2_9TREE